MKRTELLFLITFIISAYTRGQNEVGFSAQYRNGFLFTHRPTLGHLNQEKIHSLELSYLINLKDSASWARRFPSATVGASFLYTKTGNKEILGEGYGAFLLGELGFFKHGSFEFCSRNGFGLGYLTKKFDQQTNPKNMAIGSHFNLFVLFGVLAKYSFGTNQITIGADMSHFSNASWQTPNLGLNYVMLSAGYRKYFKEKPASSRKKFENNRREFIFPIYLNLGFKEVYPTGGIRYPVIGINPTIQKGINDKIGFELGADVLYRASTRGYAPEFQKSNLDLVQAARFVGTVFYFDRFTTLVGCGAYFVDKYSPNGAIYNRVGFRYQFSSNWVGGLMLKAIWGRADYLEWSFGYQIKQRK